MVEEATFSTELLEMKRQYIQLINSVIEDSNTLVTKLKCGDIMHERLLNVSGKLKLAPNKVQIFEAKSEEQC